MGVEEELRHVLYSSLFLYSPLGWFSLARPPKLAFDHKEILAHVRKHLKERDA